MPGHVLGATGAGDVKFMAAIGAIVGPALVVSSFLFTALAGGVLARRRRRQAATVGRDDSGNRTADCGARGREEGNPGGDVRRVVSHTGRPLR